MQTLLKWKNLNKEIDKLQLTHLWFVRNLSCIFVVWILTFYSSMTFSLENNF